jgi:hypothetical protein
MRKGGKLKMSILQDYERIRRDLLPGEFKAMERYLEAHQNVYLSNIYYDPETYKDFRSWWKNEKKEDEEE